MTKYRTGGRRQEIEAVEVARETKDCVFFYDNRREAKKTDYHMYHDTWQEARDFLIRKATGLVDRYETALADARKEIAKALALEPPKETGDA